MLTPITYLGICRSTGKEICHVAEGDSEDIDLAVKAARKAFEGKWRETSNKVSAIYSTFNVVYKHC